MAEVKNTTMPVTGMTCANCAATIERNVRKLPGVNVANVNLASEKLTVTFDPALLDEHGIIAPRRTHRLRRAHGQDRAAYHRAA